MAGNYFSIETHALFIYLTFLNTNIKHILNINILGLNKLLLLLFKYIFTDFRAF